ncbi:MAG: UDP-N-acetylglucosamine 2-epimerase [Candidatus Omnitrophota bacterium]
MKKIKICIVTGSRADYSHLRWLMKHIQDDACFKLQIIATGSHLSDEFGLTDKVITRDGFSVSEKLNILKYANTEIGMAKSIGKGCELFVDAFRRLVPDWVVIFADRFEMLSAAIAAYTSRIPIAHIHGGETSQGAMDEAFRHSITKMSSIHFAAAEAYRKRIIQLGENPSRVFNYGSPSLEAIYQQELLTKKELSRVLGFDISGTTAIFTYHPVTLEKDHSQRKLDQALKAISSFNFKVIFTKANADAYGNIINKKLYEFCKIDTSKYKLFDSLGPLQYFSCLKYCDLMIGNSSSGLVEAPSFHLPVVNIGDRQKGRMRSGNIIDVDSNYTAIRRGIKKALSAGFRRALQIVKNPHQRFKDGRASYRIKEKIKKLKFNEEFLKKEFYDIDFINTNQ